MTLGGAWNRVFVPLKPWEERPGQEHSVPALVERLRGPLSRIGGARVLPFQPPSIRGVGSVGGFQYLVEDEQFRNSPQDIGAFYVRSEGGAMIPLESLVKVSPAVSAQSIRHYNLFRSAEVNGQSAPGVSSGQALAAMEQLAREQLPQGMNTEWTGISLEQKESGGQTMIIFALGLLFVFLVLAAQYESFTQPFVIILSVPLAILGALGLQVARGFANDVFCQVGLVMLVGLASKNAILIVEFAEQLRESGKSAVDAVVEAAGVRLWPILMTSIAFLLGVVPLMMAKEAIAPAPRPERLS